MSKLPSVETQLRTTRHELKRARVEIAGLKGERDAYRTRAMKAERESYDWKCRFDALLKIVPEKP